MKIIEIRDDCGFSKGVVVSKIGFTPDAIKFAEYNNIGLVELREPAEEDLENRLKGINVNIYPTKPEILEFKNILHESESQEELSFEFNTNDAYYLFPDTSIKTIKNILHEFFAGIWHSQKFNVIIETETIFPDITHLKSSSNNLSIRVKLLLIKGILRTDFQETVAIKWEDKVWLIMKAVFERKMFTVSPAGKIQEIPYD